MSELDSSYVYPRDTEPYWTHRDCAKNTAGTHRGNLYCIAHGVRVAERDAEQTAVGTMWHPAPGKG